MSRTGLDVEAQILDGGGMANTGGRGGWRSSELDVGNHMGPGGSGPGGNGRESIELKANNSGGSGNGMGPSPVRRPTPLRASSA